MFTCSATSASALPRLSWAMSCSVCCVAAAEASRLGCLTISRPLACTIQASVNHLLSIVKFMI